MRKKCAISRCRSCRYSRERAWKRVMWRLLSACGKSLSLPSRLRPRAQRYSSASALYCAVQLGELRGIAGCPATRLRKRLKTSRYPPRSGNRGFPRKSSKTFLGSPVPLNRQNWRFSEISCHLVTKFQKSVEEKKYSENYEFDSKFAKSTGFAAKELQNARQEITKFLNLE